MKAWVGLMNWNIPNPTCGDRVPQAHTPFTDASFTYRTVSFTENQRSQIQAILH